MDKGKEGANIFGNVELKFDDKKQKWMLEISHKTYSSNEFP